VRAEPAGHRSAYPVDRQLLSSVRSLSSALDTTSAASVDADPADAATATPQPFDLLGPYRYLFNPAVDVQAGGQSGLAGGGFAEVQTVLAKWNAVGASFQYSFGSTSGPARCTSQQLGNSRVTIAFNDPCAEISNSGGTLAIGGSYFFTSGASSPTWCAVIIQSPR
jgi:hypothetical protein